MCDVRGLYANDNAQTGEKVGVPLYHTHFGKISNTPHWESNAIILI